MRLSNPNNIPRSNQISRSLSSDRAIEQTQKKLFDLEQELYLEGARNFLFIDVPPIDKSPACELVPFLFTLRILSAHWMVQFRTTLDRQLAGFTKGGMKYFGRMSKHFYQKTKISRRWSYPLGIFSTSSSKRLPTMVLGKGTSASGMDLYGLIMSILRAVCTSTLLRESTNTLAVIRLMRAYSLIDSHVVHNSEVKYHYTEVVGSINVSISIVEWWCIIRLDIWVHVDFV